MGALPRVPGRCCSWRNPAPVRRAVWAAGRVLSWQQDEP